MSFYPDTETFLDVMQVLFERLYQTPGATNEFARSGLKINVHVREPEAFIGLNARNNPIDFTFEPDSVPADISLYLDADVLHRVWLSEIRLRDAFFGGQIKTQGSIFKAMQLASLFRQAEAQYPGVLREKGLL